MTLEEKVRDILTRNFVPDSEEHDNGMLASEIVDDTTKELMTMLRQGRYS